MKKFRENDLQCTLALDQLKFHEIYTKNLWEEHKIFVIFTHTVQWEPKMM